MTTFKSAITSRTMSINGAGDCLEVVISGRRGGEPFDCPVSLDPADGPAIALAVLEAAGIDSGGSDWRSDAQWAVYRLTQAIKEGEAKAAAAAEEAARDKRRDELGAKFTGVRADKYPYSRVSGPLKNAIDALIDTENELAKERNK